MLEEFKIEHMRSLDNGSPAKMVEHDIRAAVSDAVRRGGVDGKSRKVILQIEVVAVPDTDGLVEDVYLRFASKVVLPPQHTKTYQAKAGPRGAMLLNAASPADPNQKTLDEMKEGKNDAP